MEEWRVKLVIISLKKVILLTQWDNKFLKKGFIQVQKQYLWVIQQIIKIMDPSLSSDIKFQVACLNRTKSRFNGLIR